MNDKWLVVCDIDGTLLLPRERNPGLEEFSRFIESRRDRIVFVLNSGRGLEEIAEVAERGPIPKPDWLVCGVGTELYADFDPASYDLEWESYMKREWAREEIREALAETEGLQEQEAWLQHNAKLSYYLDGDIPSVLAELDRKTKPWEGSFKRLTCLGLYLDILPLWGGKGGPIHFLADRLGIPESRIIAAGDSGNDRDMLDRGFNSIIVSNHSEEIRDLVGRDGVHLASKPAAAGVLEGLTRFGLR